MNWRITYLKIKETKSSSSSSSSLLFISFLVNAFSPSRWITHLLFFPFFSPSCIGKMTNQTGTRRTLASFFFLFLSIFLLFYYIHNHLLVSQIVHRMRGRGRLKVTVWPAHNPLVVEVYSSIDRRIKNIRSFSILPLTLIETTVGLVFFFFCNMTLIHTYVRTYIQTYIYIQKKSFFQINPNICCFESFSQ